MAKVDSLTNDHPRMSIVYRAIDGHAGGLGAIHHRPFPHALSYSAIAW
jgi:hypothetical protein